MQSTTCEGPDQNLPKQKEFSVYYTHLWIRHPEDSEFKCPDSEDAYLSHRDLLLKQECATEGSYHWYVNMLGLLPKVFDWVSVCVSEIGVFNVCRRGVGSDS